MNAAMERRAERQQQRFVEWIMKRTAAEDALASMAVSFEKKYFSDLRLTTGRIRRRFFVMQEKTSDGRWVDFEDVSPGVSVENWIFTLRHLRGSIGRCDGSRETITLRPGLTGDERRYTLLHEMIHAYLFQIPVLYKELILLDLHSRISRRITARQLRRHISLSMHSQTLRKMGGQALCHELLFLLKSLDLDMRLGLKPGSVFGYEREGLLG